MSRTWPALFLLLSLLAVISLVSLARLPAEKGIWGGVSLPRALSYLLLGLFAVGNLALASYTSLRPGWIECLLHYARSLRYEINLALR